MRKLLAFCVAVLLAAACSSGSGVIGVDAGTDGALDLVSGDTADLVAPELPEAEDLFELMPREIIDDLVQDVDPGCQPGDGCFLDPCSENEECLSGWCVEHLGDSVCTQQCVEECPPGWACKGIGSGGPDMTFVCVSHVANLCKPCGANADCKSPGGQDDVCVDYADEGSFCGGGCIGDDDCPWGFSCVAADSVEGVNTKQCVADAGVCPCSAKSISLGLSTPCQSSNEFGNCGGKRVCLEDGLSDCSAAEAQEEQCNGLDDDCDGFVDEPDEVGGNFINLCDDGNACTADSCDGEGGCSHEILTDTECVDGDSCTVGDHCEEGVCTGSPVVCDDNNPCTDNVCGATGGCEYPPNMESCDDGDPCTVNDQCSEGSCQGFAVDCDCQTDADCAALEDGNLCNGTLVCDTSALPYTCKVDESTVVDCPEPEGVDAICLAASCDPLSGDCSFVPAHGGYACNDGNACTAGDECVDGVCVSGAALNCADDNPCTDDSCDPGTGCTHVPNTAPCSDGNVCTTSDVCSDGACVSGAAKECFDDNPCTADSCDPVSGCVFAPNDGECTDGNNCTTGDHCAAGKCAFDDFVDCSDGNLCTTDSCDPSQGCVFSLNNLPCDDGDICTSGDHCQLGECVSGVMINCDDDNPCTDDSCGEAGCVHLANAAPCDDLNACSTESMCQNKQCVAVTMVQCDDGNVCTDDVCDPEVGCVFTNNEVPCSDGNACTADDSCQLGLCEPGEAVNCDDGNLCTDDSCHALLGCQYVDNTLGCDDGNQCTTGDSCANGECLFNGLLECDDGNVCTDDSCSPATGCVFEPNTVACDDADACTDASECTAGACVGTSEVVCDPDAWCADKACIGSCMTASCDADAGCGFAPIPDCCGNGIKDGNEGCDDGNLTPGDGCDEQCESEGPPGPYYMLTGDPNTAIVFNDMDVTFKYPNNLTNGIWHKNSNLIKVGEFSTQGYWSHPANAGGWPASPNNGTGYYGRLVHMPGTRLVAYTNVPASNGLGSAPANSLRLATIDADTGAFGPHMAAQFSDGYSGTCNVLSSSVTDLYILNGTSQVRRYSTTQGSSVLTLVEVIALSSALPSNATCAGGNCYGGSFAYDGKYFYFAENQTGSGHLTYRVYTPNGTYVTTHTASGSGGINGVYFDWSVGRYAIHDGYGQRSGGTVYTGDGGASDSQVYGHISSYHTLVP